MAFRGELIEVFEDTMKWIREDEDLAAVVERAKERSEIFYEHMYPAFDTVRDRETRISLSGDRTFQAAVRLMQTYPGDRIAVMNFANAFVPGGGVTVGATAQEESLCRCSTLYPVLNQQYLLDNFYDYHEELGSPMATDTLIYSEGIVICKSDSDIPKRLPKENWTAVDVITVAAPDLSPWGMKQENGEQPLVITREALLGYHIRRAVHVLTVAASKHVDILVLGAFGCGAFINDPETVAKAYKIALQEFFGVFRHIEFAIKSGEEKTRNYRAFEKVFC